MAADDLRKQLLGAAEALAPGFRELALRLHAEPEVGLEERQAAEWIGEMLRAEGFAVDSGVADLPTALIARWRGPTSRPVIAFLAEYDALPELGHACGHNLIASAACLAAVALTKVIAAEQAARCSPGEHRHGGPAGLAAQVRVIGCPAEESYAGKAQLVEHGIFADVDVALMAHGYKEHVASRPASGRKSIVIEFHGKSSHAAAAPEQGVNALDAMILTFNGIALLRQQLRDEARIHGIITHGGKAANTIPHYTRAELYVRSFDLAYLDELAERVIACARGAAEATGARLEVGSATLTMLPIRPNQVLQKCYEESIRFLGETVGPPPEGLAAGSTDFGNVSQVVPGLHAYFRVTEEPAAAHTAAFAEASKSEAGLRGMVVGAKALALTALDLITDPQLLAAAQRELEERERRP